MLKNILKYIFSLIFAGGLMYWTLKDYNFSENIEKLKSANFFWFYLSAFFTIIAHSSRGIRSKMLLKPLGYQPNTVNSILAIFMGYFANYLVPRLGEVTRCTSLATTDKVPFEKTFGTVVTERIIDMAILFFLLIITFFLEFDRLSGFFLSFFNDKFQDGFSGIIIPFVGVFVLAFTLFFVLKNYKAKILSFPLIQKLSNLLKGLLEGLLSIRKLENPIAFIGHSLLIWLMYFLMTYCMFFAFEETANLSLVAGLSTLVMGAIGIAAPTPGGLGTYHALVGNLMVLYGLSAETGKTLAIFLHGSQMVITLTFGIISFIILFFIKRK